MRDEEGLQRVVEVQRTDPFAHSQLPYWLGLEVWTQSEGLLVLSCIEPGTVEDSRSSGASTWTNAMPFSQHVSFFQLPDPQDLTLADHRGDEAAFEKYLEHQEDRRALLQDHQTTYEALLHKLDHSPSALGESVTPGKWRPLAFVAWAESIKFKPLWLDWARENGVLPDALHPEAAPFFDPEQDDYPELLHIAIRAWEHARKGGQGTPKQRIEAFLSDRYGHLKDHTRTQIASVANWEKAGGRPRKEETSNN